MIPLRDINPTRTRPVVNWAIIAVNAVMFFYELSLGVRLDNFLLANAFIPGMHAGGADPIGWLGSALLSMFLHAGWMHFLGNMVFLWVFGDNVEDRLGHARYVAFYLLSGLAATFVHGLAAGESMMPAIGASGAISGVLGAYVFMYPRARVVTAVILVVFVRLVEIPAMVYLPLWFGIQLFSGLASLRATEAAATGGVAWFAHIGGFVAGPLLAFLMGGFKRPPAVQQLPY